MIHVRFDGRSLDLEHERLHLHRGASLHGITDREILDRVADHLDVARERLRGHVVDRTAHGDVIVRPEAVYG